MKSFILAILFLAIFQTSFAQKYEYNIFGKHFSDTLSSATTTDVNQTSAEEREAIFERPEDTTYIYHLVGEGESIVYIFNLYQICAPCLVEWNNFDYSKTPSLYTGEYLKVALKKDYENGMTTQPKKRRLYENFTNRIYIYDIVNDYGVNINDLRLWNNLDPNSYYIENMRLIVGEQEYKYACPCLE
jgi:hypothetical protein